MTDFVEQRLDRNDYYRRLVNDPERGMLARGFSLEEVAAANAHLTDVMTTYEGVTRSPTELRTPVWAPRPLGVPVSRVRVMPGWVLLEEDFEAKRWVMVGGLNLELPQLGTPNTVVGRVLAIQDSIGVCVGDSVVYREWQGGRWECEGRQVLLIAVEHVLARVEA